MRVIAILVFTLFGISISFYDVSAQIIRNLVLCKLFLFLLFYDAIILLVNQKYPYDLGERAINFGVVALFYCILAIISNFAIGAGDIKYALVISFFLVSTLPIGSVERGNLISIFIAWSVGFLQALIERAHNKKPKAIPMAPALFFGAICALFDAFLPVM